MAEMSVCLSICPSVCLLISRVLFCVERLRPRARNLPLWLPSVNRLMNNYFVQSNTHPFTPSSTVTPLSVVQHTSPVPVYVIYTSFHPKSPALTSVILFSLCCTKTVFFSFLAFNSLISSTLIVHCV